MSFGWVFAMEHPSSMDRWFILPVEPQQMRGFDSMFPPNLVYTNAPWTGLHVAFERVQWLRDRSILPGKEYIIWFSFPNAQPSIIHFAFDLFPATEKLPSRRVIDSAFGLKGNLRDSD